MGIALHLSRSEGSAFNLFGKQKYSHIFKNDCTSCTCVVFPVWRTCFMSSPMAHLKWNPQLCRCCFITGPTWSHQEPSVNTEGCSTQVTFSYCHICCFICPWADQGFNLPSVFLFFSPAANLLSLSSFSWFSLESHPLSTYWVSQCHQ